MDYRSFLNKDYVPIPKDLTPASENPPNYRPTLLFSGETQGAKGATGGRAARMYTAGGLVKQEDSARLETLNSPQPEGSGVGLFVVEGGILQIGLDGMYMKNIIIRNAEVTYNGGSVRLENVAFVNCKFFFTKSEPTIKFGEAVMQANAVSYSTISS